MVNGKDTQTELRSVGQKLNARILVISDNAESGYLWGELLKARQYEITLALTVQEAIQWRAEQASDLILVDSCDPTQDPNATIRALRGEATVPILLLLADYNDTRALEAYRAGVDECIAKPVEPRLFLAKVGAWLARAWQFPAEMLDSFQIGPLRLDTARRQLVAEDGTTIRLTNLELRLLYLLVAHAGQVLPTSVIIDRVWGYTGGGDNTLVKNVVYRLRRKIEPNPAEPRHILAVNGEGYMFHS